MKPTYRLPLFLVLLALVGVRPGLLAQDPAPSPTPVAAKPDAAPTPTAAAASAPNAAPASGWAGPEASAPEAPLHEVAPAKAADEAQEEHAQGRHHHHSTDPDDMVGVMGPVSVLAGEHCEGNAVAVMGPLKVDGTVDGNAVTVMGSSTINGTVSGNAVAVLGSLKLGPKARVEGDVVTVGGHLDRDPSAYVGGKIVNQAVGAEIYENEDASAWFEHGLRHGRLLTFAPHVVAVWMITLVLAGIYILLAWIFPSGVTRCADTLEKRPGLTLLVGFLSIMALPLIFVLLLVTIVGIPVAVLGMPLAILAAIVFGKAGIFALVGRSMAGRQTHPVSAVALGLALFVALLLVPVVGILLFLFVGWIGYSAAVTTVFTLHSSQAGPSIPAAAAPVAPAPVPAPASPAPAADAPVAAQPLSATPPAAAAEPAPAEPAAAQPPPLDAPVPPVIPAGIAVPPAPAPLSHASEAALPRAGFWIRILALLVDAVLVAIVVRSHSFFLPALAVYGALLWKLRGATVGDIIFGLKVVRHDGREFDWTTAIVRGLGCFLSLIFIGLGFIWIAFDRERQAWHDKIAGTVVVRLPKAVSLV